MQEYTPEYHRSLKTLLESLKTGPFYVSANKYFKCANRTMVFKQIMFWSKKGRRRAIFKSARELGEEIGLDTRKVDGVIKWLIENGHITMPNKEQINGSQTRTFLLNEQTLIELAKLCRAETSAAAKKAKEKAAKKQLQQAVVPTTESCSSITDHNHRPKRRDIIETAFKRFWESYPKRVDKKESEGIFNRLMCGRDEKQVDSIVQKLTNHCTVAYADTAKTFIPSPVRYLKGEKWEDEIYSNHPLVKNHPTIDQAFQNLSFIDRHTDKSWRAGL